MSNEKFNVEQIGSMIDIELIDFNLIWVFLFNFATRAGTPQQHTPITASPHHLTHPVNFPCGRKPEKTHDFRQSVDILLSHEDWVRVTLWDALLESELLPQR